MGKKEVQASEVLGGEEIFLSSRDSFPRKLTFGLGFEKRASIHHAAKTEK